MKKIFFIGICGISMSALAVLLKEQGYEVLGCDKNYKKVPKILEKNNIKVFPERKTKEIVGSDFVVVSSAIKEDNKALICAKKHNKICKSRGEILGEIAKGYEKVIAVAGSHGKTTTTAMIYNILSVAGLNPTLHLGGNLCKEKTNCISGGKEFFVTEACEYYDNFLHLHPFIGVVTKIEEEHLDYFKTFENEKKSFEKFMSQSENVVHVLSSEAKNIKATKKGGVKFDIYKDNQFIMNVNLKIGGFYNAKNALYAYECCEKLDISKCKIKLGLESFCGTEKRLEKKKYFEKNIIVDYAHHPTEIENVYEFLKKTNKKINLIFQPHTFSRTKEFERDFIKILSKFDKLFLFKTYAAREKPKDGLSAFELSKKIEKSSYFEDVEQVKQLIQSQKDDEITVIMGAGDLPEKLGLY